MQLQPDVQTHKQRHLKPSIAFSNFFRIASNSTKKTKKTLILKESNEIEVNQYYGNRGRDWNPMLQLLSLVPAGADLAQKRGENEMR